MKIQESPISYRTPLREAQVRLMAKRCREMQALWDDAHASFLSEAGWLEKAPVCDFMETAEACGFICKEWDVMPELKTVVISWNGLPQSADMRWLRYFLHSLIRHDLEQELAYEYLTLLLGKVNGYAALADALDAQLKSRQSG
ncbi:hypothetical protein [Halomonas sp. IOP_31]|uniref:hypothetical protein n=1 Tax=Halomonas sp. IOP_31 TaxID=2876584 RepID=UPI001E5FC5A5|nr:hypothetical protein [Halomonas sp. IOP_31]MCD6010050.1 hypothetical protein [Halomonas sp. IOP_31]